MVIDIRGIWFVIFFLTSYSVAAKMEENSREKPPEEVFLADYLIGLSQIYNQSIVFRASDLEGVAISVNLLEKKSQNLDKTLTEVLQGTGLSFKKHASGFIVYSLASQSNTQQFDSEIVIKGFRQSLLDARNIKMDSTVIKDVIVAEDIADFPDLNLADALQRIPGVVITREAGEGRQIAVRGLGPDFVQVKLNGMNVLGNSDSPLDSRGQKTRDRAFDFNIFASELFSQVTLHKAYTASEQEGGIAGTVGLHTPKPFQNPGFQGVLSANFGDNEFTEDISPRVAGLFSNTWGKWGALFSFAANQRETEEQGANTIRWRRLSHNNADISNLDPNIQDLWRNQELFVPRGNRYSVWQSEQKRYGFTSAFQFKTDTFEIGVDVLSSQFQSLRDEYHLATRGFQSTPIINESTSVVSAEISSENELIFAEYHNGQIATESRRQEVNIDFLQSSVYLNADLTETFKMHGLLGSAKSELNMPISNKIYTEGVSDVTLDYRPDSFYGTYTYSIDTTDPNEWLFHEVDLEQYYASSEYQIGLLDWEWQITDAHQLKFGISWNQLENATAQRERNNLFRDEWQAFSESETGNNLSTTNIALNARLIQDLYFVLDDHERQSWVAIKHDETLDYLGIDSESLFFSEQNGYFGIDDSDNKLVETTNAFYVESTWSKELELFRLNTSLGFRHYDTQTDTTVNQRDNEILLERNYSGGLGSLNSALWFSDNLVIKASASQNITRPDFIALADGLNVRVVNETEINISGVNPNLRPYFSTNFDLSFEKYFAPEGYIALAWFHKNIDDFIVTESRRVNAADIGLPLEQLGLSVTDQTPVNYTAKFNSENAKINGLEFVVQKNFDFLPQPFNNMGTLLNYTYARGELTYYDEQNGTELFTKDAPQLSRNAYNATLYYETPIWGARISSAYRSRYISRVDTNVLNDEDERGFHGTNFIDGQIYYFLNENLKLSLEAINLTGEREEQYSDSSDRAYNTTASGRTFILGFIYDLN